MMEEDPVALLLSDELMEEDDESEIYEIEYNEYENEEDEDIVIAATSDPNNSEDMDASFFLEDDEDDNGLVEENPFEPVYPAASAGLLFENDDPKASANSQSIDKSATATGIVLEAVSLDNILPAGSRRRRN